MDRPTRVLLKVIGMPLVVLGLMGFAAPLALLENTAVRRALRNTRLPLGDTAGLALMEECGTLYHGSDFYRQVQVYDLEGRFLRSWFVDADGGRFVMEPGEDCRLVVETVRNRLRLVFDEHGTEVAREALADGPSREKARRVASGGDGRVYRVERSRLGAPRIVRIDASGERRVLVTTPLAAWLVSGPFPAWIWVAAGVVLLACGRRREESEGRRVSQGGSRSGDGGAGGHG